MHEETIGRSATRAEVAFEQEHSLLGVKVACEDGAAGGTLFNQPFLPIQESRVVSENTPVKYVKAVPHDGSAAGLIKHFHQPVQSVVMILIAGVLRHVAPLVPQDVEG